MQDFVYFLGRLHVLALHLPIGIIIAAVATDWIARRNEYKQLAIVCSFLWGLAAASALVTVVLGYLHFAEGAFTGSSASAHRFFGTTVAVITIFIWQLSRHAELYRRVNVVTGIVALALVTITGHFGGNLTHGPAFLTQYAPGPLRALAGDAARRRVTDVAAADPYLDVVRPVLERRCMNCHGTDKHENGFSMATYESTMKGGDTGADIVPGKADGSELYRRITLPHDDDDFMPAEGKAPLTADQVKILRWWIDAGAPHHTTVGAIGGDAGIVRAIATELGIGGPGVMAPGQTSESPASADPAMVARLYTAGFLVRQVSQTDAHLVVSVYSPGSQVGPEQMAVLASAGQNIVELNLQDASVEDSMAAELGKLPAVTRLRLSGNKLTDRGIAALVALPRLERLNVYGNAGITDASVDTLANAKSLRRVDVWQTGITDAGVARLRQRRPDVEVQGASGDVLKTGVPERGGGVR